MILVLFNFYLDLGWVKILEKDNLWQKLLIRSLNTLGEYESIIDVYERNGYKVKSKTDKETILFKKTRTKNGELLNLLL